MTCTHCRNGFLDNQFGQDVECVNGVLIDIDEYYEGHDPHRAYPVAPCHPDWDKQCSDPGEWVSDDVQSRLSGRLQGAK
ncbi:hypothetical protein [Brevundimonas olei]|uniref:hypothetical protein n=1 Tax=Brevundimonas olei TaxID=657642 RepID=UPI0031DE1366